MNGKWYVVYKAGGAPKVSEFHDAEDVHRFIGDDKGCIVFPPGSAIDMSKITDWGTIK